MTNKEMLEQLESIKDHCRCMSEETSDIWAKDVEALDAAITALRAQRDGKLVGLPCEVGDQAYWVHNGVITDCRVHRIQINRSGMFLCLKSTRSHGAFRVDMCLGKTVFLTHKAAEAALAGET